MDVSSFKAGPKTCLLDNPKDREKLSRLTSQHFNTGRIAGDDEMTILNPSDVGFAHYCKHRDSAQYLEQSKPFVE